ncbi:hypothetical protein TNCV_4983891 [Trichonephila clavipes]|nr:hypothetical protein TNCV_4983891 [Trichonephila clavipes]
MKAYEDIESKVTVEFTKTLVGHGIDLGRMKITREEKKKEDICHGSLVVMAGMSRVQAKYPPCRGTMHIKSVEFKRPPIGVVVRRGEFQLRCRL